MKNYFSILLASAAILLAGCSKTGADDLPGGGESVAFTTSFPDNPALRGTLVTDAAGLADMGVFCAATGTTDWSASDVPNKMFNQKLNNTSGTWTYPSGEDHRWDAATMGDRYTFFAYTPFAAASNGITVNGSSATAGVPTLTYAVPTTTADQPDLMVAVARKDLRPTSGSVALHMKHALTSVSFKIGAYDAGRKLTGIRITGVSMEGELVVDGDAITWPNLGPVVTDTDLSALLDYDSGESYYTIPTGASASPIAGNGYLMMIPQTLTDDAKLTLTFDGESDCVIDLDAHIWEAGKHVIYQITLLESGEILVAPSNVTMLCPAGVGGSFGVKCQRAGGAEAPDMEWTFSVPATAPWLRLSTNATAEWSDAVTILSGSGSATIYLVAEENTSTTTDRTATVTLEGTADEVEVKQLRGITSGGTVLSNSYVGAFWRNTQTGERVIKINVGTAAGNLGAWTASVVWMDGRWNAGDIVLADGFGASESILYTEDPGNAESYQVEGNSTTVSGTALSGGTIAFRIGLKSQYTATAAYPARYALVALSYNDNSKTQILYLRQGEGDDYVMRPGDPGVGVDTGEGTRPLAVKISPYNLTCYDFKASASIAHRGVDVTARSGEMTEYPTQAGAHYKWAEKDAEVVAYNPAVTPSNWSILHFEGYWNNAGTNNTNETYDGCPIGYRRWNDGDDLNTGPISMYNINATNSEIGQSLFVDPPTGETTVIANSAWGYYADGFFDRRTIGQQTALGGGSAAYSAVSTNNSAIAYVGRLFYNPTTNASLFFPGAGRRSYGYGELYNPGAFGYYWSGSSTAIANSIGLYIYSGYTSRSSSHLRYDGFSVRCVVAE